MRAYVFAVAAIVSSFMGNAVVSVTAQVNNFSDLAPVVAASAPEEEKALPLPKGKPRRPVGLPAVNVSPDPVQPFTLKDVSAFFKTHNLPTNLGSSDQFQVDTLLFLSSGEVSKLLQGVSTGLQDNELVGFATLSGALSIPKLDGGSVTFSRGYAVFDATTGNLLVAGAL